MQEPTIRQLRHFILVAESGSFRTAAERAFRSQSALSLSVRELEGVLGGNLFQEGRRAQLTDYGRQCLPIARDIVERYERQATSLRSGGRSAMVTMAVLPSFASRWLPGFLATFAADYPDIALRVVDDNSSNIEELVLSGRADIGIVSLSGADPRLSAKVLVKDEFCLACNRKDPLAKEKWLPWSAVKGPRVLGNLTHPLLSGTQASRYVQSPRLFIANMTSLMSLVSSGDWISPLPAMAVPLHATNVVAVPLRRPKIERRIGLIRLRRTASEPAIDVVEKLLRQSVSPNGP